MHITPKACFLNVLEDFFFLYRLTEVGNSVLYSKVGDIVLETLYSAESFASNEYVELFYLHCSKRVE